MQQEREIDANRIIQSLQARIGQLVSQYETEIAYRDAIIAGLEEDESSPTDIQVAEE